MSKRYPGNFITGNPVALSQTSNNGIWDTKDNYQATTAGTWQEPDGIYEIPRSLRFNSTSTAYLNKTFASAGNRTTWTWSAWVKISNSANDNNLFSAQNGTTFSRFAVNVSTLYMGAGTSAVGWSWAVQSSPLYRDPSAWYHIVVSYDTTQAVASNRVKMYVNGVQAAATSASTYPSQNATWSWNAACEHMISGYNDSTYGRGSWFDGYMTESNFIDGQALDPTYFGYFDGITNIWQPKKYTGSYGTNGYYLPFSENSGLRGLGKNFAGSNYIGNTSLSHSDWGGTVTKTSNSTTAPDGTTTAATINATSNYQYFNAVYNFGFTTENTNITASIYLKRGNTSITTLGLGVPAGYDRDMISILWNGDNGPNIAQPSSGSSLYKGTIVYVGNGWYRVSMTTTYSGASNYNLVVWPAGSGAHPPANGYCYAWGPQVNLGVGPDNFIPTSGTQAINDWTPNNFTLNPGDWVNTCSFVDSPTNVMTSATDIGGTVSGNYATLNSLVPSTGTIQYANSYVQTSTANATSGTIFANTGKWYAEVYVGSNAGSNAYIRVGVVNTAGAGADLGGSANGWCFLGDGRVYNNGSSSTYGTACTTGDIINIALDLDAGKVWYAKNGTWMASGNPVTGANPSQTFTANQYMTFAVASGSSNPQYGVNFGAINFSFTPPAGFKSLNTTNMQALGTSAVGKAALTPNKWFDTTIYGGTGLAQTIVNGGFSPDLIWTKTRSHAVNNDIHSTGLGDLTKGSSVFLQTNTTNEANYTAPQYSITTNNSGYSIDSYGDNINQVSRNFVSWQWKQSPTSGLNILTWEGNSTAGRTISHNLGAAPKFVIIRFYNYTGADWAVFHEGIGWDKQLQLNSTGAASTYAGLNNTAPTSSNLTLGSNGGTNGSPGSYYIGWLWAEVPGFSKFGKYTGNGSTDGVFVHTGFRPAFVMVKATNSAENWAISDNRRNNNALNTNPINAFLRADESSAETTGAMIVDFTSSGFKLRNSDTKSNGSGWTYVYAAFAESPFALNNRAK